MPHLDRFIRKSTMHRETCPIVARRLYIREGPKGKQKFVPWGAVCLICGLVVYPSGGAGRQVEEPEKMKRQEKRRWNRHVKKNVKIRERQLGQPN